MVKWRDTYEKDLKLMLEKVCGDHGFCDALHFANELCGKPAVTATEFADFVLTSEEMDSAREDRWRDTLRTDFLTWFKRDAVAAAD